MDSRQVREKFLEFFKEKGHAIIPPASLIPENDPTALFTSAGMQQFVPYLSGEVEPPYRRATSVQKCFRTSDIDEVGDESHHTFFEMLGNWSFGDYFKEEAIAMALELLTDKKNGYGLDKNKISVSVFKGDENVGADEESIKIWQTNGIPKERIKSCGAEDNFWGPVISTGPCGPCSEIYYNGVEIWNLVFMEYNKTKDDKFEKLPAKNVDTGMGLERLCCVLQGVKSNFETDLFLPIIQEIEKLSLTKYHVNSRSHRIIADHMRAICFLISDGVLPAKDDRGYILRKLIRRVMVFGKNINLKDSSLIDLAKKIIDIDYYKENYPDLSSHQNDIVTVVLGEATKFNNVWKAGEKKIKVIRDWWDNYYREDLSAPEKIKLADELGQRLAQLYQSDGLHADLVLDRFDFWGEDNFQNPKYVFLNNGGKEFLLKYVSESFKNKQKDHQDISRAGREKKFGGVGDFGEQVAPQHTATHLLQAALRQILGEHVHQAGSDLTPERLRFDFTYPEKLTAEQLKQAEDLVNKKIKENFPVKMEEMPYEEAIKSGALAFFKEKYPKVVRVFSVGGFSKEVCAGPHVKNTSEIKNFKIIKSETSGPGIQRIKAIVNF